MKQEELDVLVRAVLWIADNGWRLLPFYQYNRYTAMWTHRFFSNAAVEKTFKDFHLYDEDPDIEHKIENVELPHIVRACMKDIAKASYRESTGSSFRKMVEEPTRLAQLLCDAESKFRGLKHRTVNLNATAEQITLQSLVEWARRGTLDAVIDPAWRHLIWFARPSDAAYSMGVLEKDSAELGHEIGIPKQAPQNEADGCPADSPWELAVYSGVPQPLDLQLCKYSLDPKLLNQGRQLLSHDDTISVSFLFWLRKTKGQLIELQNEKNEMFDR
eukprot:Gregarina_sp_Poly_1__10501@NODE_76_length_15862_cov_98_864577_g65_i0_p9_GENE_NODE_76_length_15862_cov_98_864577_g65_i0NODE_76_length_15862_cov_98_864577_g65_i0_p9_ORF_typecomplete_len273_score30_93LMSTEN/PF07988_12/0_16_NODE_76_length_15862_cov_98_864577_g65_i01123712055